MAKKFDFALWLEAARPKTWPASITPVLLGIADGARYPMWDLGKALGCVAVALGLQIAANFFNDADDTESGADLPHRAGPRRLVADGLISKSAIRGAGVLMIAVVAAIALAIVPFEQPLIWIIGAASVLAAVTYTGFGVAYGYKGLGEAICFVFFGPVAVIGTEIVVANMITMEGVLLGLGAGALSVAILEVNNIRDAETDKKAGKMTFAARFGRELGCKIYFWAVMGALLVNAVLAVRYFWVWGAAIIVLIMGGRIHAALGKKASPAQYNKALALTAVMLLLWGVSTAIGIWLGPVPTPSAPNFKPAPALKA